MPGVGGRGEWEPCFNGDIVSVWEDEKVLKVHGGDACTTVETYLKPQNCTLKTAKVVNVMSISPVHMYVNVHILPHICIFIKFC